MSTLKITKEYWKKLKTETNGETDASWSRTGGYVISKLAAPPVIFRISVITTQAQWLFPLSPTETDKLIRKSIIEQKIQKSQNNLGKKERSWRTHTFHFQSLLQSYQDQNGVVLESPEISLHIYSQLDFNKGDKWMSEWAKSSLSHKWCWDNWDPCGKQWTGYHIQKIVQNRPKIRVRARTKT